MKPVAQAPTASAASRGTRLREPGVFKRGLRQGWNPQLQQSLSRHLQGRMKAAMADTDVQVDRAVKFSIQQRVEFGESMRVVGGSEQFGAWNPDAAPLLQWGEGHIWTWDGKLPVGEYEFKVVITRQEGAPSWEDGENRKLAVAPGNSVVEINMSWGAVNDMVVIEVPAEAPPEVPEPTASNTEVNGNGASNGSADSSDAAESLQESESSVPDTIPAALIESALERELANGTGKNGAASSSQESVSVGSADAFVSAATVVDLPESDSSSSTSSLTGTALATALANATIEQLEAKRASGQDGWEGVDPVGNVVDGLMTAATFAAVPVVGWSLYTLHSTGCGLPPGPNGALGAVEGLSYLGVTAMAGYGLYKRATGSSTPGYAVAAEVLSYSTIAVGLAVLAAQVQNYGYIPSALPDSNCYGPGSTTSASLPALSLPDVKLPPLDLQPLQNSLKQAGAALQDLKSQLPTVDTAAISSQTSTMANEALRQLQAASSASQAAIATQAQTLGAQLGSSVEAGLSKAQELSSQLGAQAGSTSTQLWLRVDSSLQSVPAQVQQLTSHLPSAADITEKLNSGLSQLTSKLPSRLN